MSSVREVMNADILTVEPETTLREAARKMSERGAGAALVVDTNVGSRPGIVTERDVLDAVAEGLDPDKQIVADSQTLDVVTVTTDAPLEKAVEKMLEGTFRHLVVVHGDDTVGMVSMRDLVLALTNGP